MTGPSQLAPAKRPKWFHITMGVSLIVVAVALTVGWHILGARSEVPQGEHAARWSIYFLGTVLFLLLIGGLSLMVDAAGPRGAPQRAPVQLRERGDARAQDAGGLAEALPRHAAAARPARRAARASSTGTMSQDLERLNATINNVLNAAMYTDQPRASSRSRWTWRAVVQRALGPDPHAPPASAGDASRYHGPESAARDGRRGGPRDRGPEPARQRRQVLAASTGAGGGRAGARTGTAQAHLRVRDTASA